MDDLLSLLDQWNQEEAYQSIIDTLEERSRTQPLDYALTCQLARAYNNLVVMADGEPGFLERAAALLESVREEGKDDPLWHYRLGYSLYHQGRVREGLECFQAALALNPEDEDTKFFVRILQKQLAHSENTSRSDKGKLYSKF